MPFLRMSQTFLLPTGHVRGNVRWDDLNALGAGLEGRNGEDMIHDGHGAFEAVRQSADCLKAPEKFHCSRCVERQRQNSMPGLNLHLRVSANSSALRVCTQKRFARHFSATSHWPLTV